MKLTRKQFNYAVKIYGLSQVYHAMGGADAYKCYGEQPSQEELDLQHSIQERTGEVFLKKLQRLGYGSELASIEDCIQAAIEKYPSHKEK